MEGALELFGSVPGREQQRDQLEVSNASKSRTGLRGSAQRLDLAFAC